MTNIAVIHVALEIWGGVFCIIATLCLVLGRNLSPKENRLMIRIQITNAVLLFSDALAWLFRGDITTLGYYMVRISNFLVFASTYFLIFAITQYIIFFIVKDKKEDKRLLIATRAIYIVVIVAICLLIISQFTNFYYAYDEQNRYYRTQMYWICIAIGVLGMLMDTILVIWKRKQLTKFLRLESMMV